MTVAHQLAGTATGRAEVEAERDVVEAQLAELEEHLTRDAGLGLGTLEHVAELALEDAIGVLGLLLLGQLHGVLGLLLATTGVAVLAWAVRTALKRLVWAKNRFLEATGNLGFGSAVTCHISKSFCSTTIKRDDALEGGTRCVEVGSRPRFP